MPAARWHIYARYVLLLLNGPGLLVKTDKDRTGLQEKGGHSAAHYTRARPFPRDADAMRTFCFGISAWEEG